MMLFMVRFNAVEDEHVYGMSVVAANDEQQARRIVSSDRTYTWKLEVTHIGTALPGIRAGELGSTGSG